MGKIVKYCSSCDEGYAEKFGYCPNCAAPLQTFEMNPVQAESVPEPEDVKVADMADVPPPVFLAEAVAEPTVEPEPYTPEPVAEAAAGIIEAPVEEIYADSHETVEPEVEEPVDQVLYTEPIYSTPAYNADEPNYTYASSSDKRDDDGYHITVIQEKNGKQRNLLLLGSAALMLTLAVGTTVVSLFNKSLGVDAIGDNSSLASLIDDVPLAVEEDKPKPEKDKGGGGGGGGRQDKTDTSLGDLADQTKNPIIRPDARIFKADFELKQPVAATEGDRKFEKKYDQYGDPNSRFTAASNGLGSGGGQGSGQGNGQGSGFGSGAGSGSGSGSGGGNGTGNGNGTGGGGNSVGAPPPAPVGVTAQYKIIAKPKATYTDEARTANVQGSVTLKIVLLASGQVGSITPVSRLPHGLTEQAIAAARQIRFEPKKVNGVPVATTVTFQYAFNIY